MIRSVVAGIDRETTGTRREHVVHATMDAIVSRTRDVVLAMATNSGTDMTTLRVDGGSVQTEVLRQLQADPVETEIVPPPVGTTTVLGPACWAGPAVGVFGSLADVPPTLADGHTGLDDDCWGTIEPSKIWDQEAA